MAFDNMNDLGLSEKEFDIIKRLITIKINELGTYKKGRYFRGNNQVTKVSFEGNEIANYLNSGNFKINFIVAYLKILKEEIISNDIKIIEYRPYDDYDGTNDFLNWIDKQLINIELKEKTLINDNPHPSIFENGAFDIFKTWIEISKDDPIKKISFIFQKLKKDNKLRNTTFKILSEWALNNNYLDNTSYNNLLIAGSFLSPSKILTKLRLELYYTIKGV